MKQNKLTTLLALLIAFSPLSVFAHPVSEELLISYCTRLLVFEVENEKKIDKIEAAYKARESVRIKDIKDIRTKQDKDIEDIRAKQINLMDKAFSKIDVAVLNGTEADKVKAEAAKQELIRIKDEHRAGVDAAIAEYRAGINNAMEARKVELATAKQIFDGKVAIILKKSKADCQAKKDVHEIFDFTTTELKKVHEEFKASIRRLDNIKTNLDGLSKTRNTEVQNAISKMKTDIQSVL